MLEPSKKYGKVLHSEETQLYMTIISEDNTNELD